MEIPLKSPGDHLGLGRAYDRSVMFHFFLLENDAKVESER